MTDQPDTFASGRPPANPTARFSPDRLRLRIGELGLTPITVARAVLDQHRISVDPGRLLDGTGRPSPELLYALASILRCRMEDLMEETRPNGEAA